MTRHAAIGLAAGTLTLIMLAGCVTERNEPAGHAAAQSPDRAAPPPDQSPEAQAPPAAQTPPESTETARAPEQTGSPGAQTVPEVESPSAEDDSVPAGFIPGGRIADAVEASQRTGRPIFVVASATWCGPCQQYRTRTLATATMAETLNSTTVPVYVDVDEDEEAVEFIRGSGANFRAIPFTVLIKDGKVVESFTGVRNPTQLTDWVNQHATRG